MNKLIHKLFSEKNSRIIFGVMCLILFSGQTYLFVTKTFFEFLRPFAEHPEIHSYVREALWDVWSKMLIWPVLLFIVVFTDVIRLRKGKG
jgi:hypothetical protein